MEIRRLEPELTVMSQCTELGAVGGFLGDFWGILCGDPIPEVMWGIIESGGVKMRTRKCV